MYELPLLKALLNRETYREYRQYLKTEEFLLELRPILKALDKWHTTQEKEPTLEDIASIAFSAGIAEKHKEYLKTALTSMQGLETDTSSLLLLERFKQEAICKSLAMLAFEASIGKKPIDEVIALAAQLGTTQIAPTEYVTDDILSIIEDHIRSPGLRWRLQCLNRSLGSLRKGDFGFVFARPETGKTTFLSSETTNMAEQLTEAAGPIIWFNNEEAGEDVKFRNYLSALGATKAQILAHPERARKAYQERIKDRILLYDNASIHRHTVESICEREKPSLIIFDQIDKLKGWKADRRDLELGYCYQWGREIAKTYCPVIGVCQADGTAENVRYLNMVHVADAKTAKQAEADFILGIGKTHDQGFEYTRFLNICKNKLTGDADTDPHARHAQYMVLIKPEIGRYEDID